MIDFLRVHPGYQSVIQWIKAKEVVKGLALPRAARLPFTAALFHDLNIPTIFITHRSDQALVIIEELGYWLPVDPKYHFREPGPLFYEPSGWGPTTRRERLQVLSVLARYHLPLCKEILSPPIIIVPARALMSRTLPRREFLSHTKTIKAGTSIGQENLIRSWLDIGYQPSEIVVEPGQFAKRGGILDIWAAAEEKPARLDFFGDELETIRLFDPATQRTVEKIPTLQVTPAREFIVAKARNLDIPEMDMSEYHLPLIHSMPATILDYLPKDALILIDDMDMLGATIEEVEEQAVRMRDDAVREGILSADYPAPYVSWSELFDEISTHHFIELGRSTAENPSVIAEAFSPVPRFGGRIKPFLDYLAEECIKQSKITVMSRQCSRLSELWNEKLATETLEYLATPHFVEGSLTEGWIFSHEGEPPTILLTDSEIFGWDRPIPRQRQKHVVETPEALYSDFKPGDWVVHIDYGIGQFVGLVRRMLEGVEREFLCIQYYGDDQLFVPIHQADRLTRYVGSDGQDPSPNRLGGGEWQHTRQRVREAVEEVAEDLLNLYAQRQVVKGFAFSKDTLWQQELEASFPYVETHDQLRAIRDVKNDMEQLRPMDRLLCGDVGYGKTEVALRAAFKAVQDDKQVAVLVPTTVLAQQHYETFRQRLSAFPVEVEMLSRFRTPKEQDEIIRKLAMGSIDIVIGTHRLLSNDIQFKSLGLVVIDEEQRFGVTHKEFLKKLRTEVDVLTLTATPIPRTLYMALTGVRDISNINTPPEERLPIITHVGPYSPKLVRQAILRELERGGQVFFVHNRVQTIPAMLTHLQNLVPEARIGVGHGQMNETELASVMQKFTGGEIDVLLCTSIIESGLDIPNANTLIVDRGDTFGLSQLYQLRGRVGRGAQRAYAYFFRHRKKLPTLEGQERLEIIAENTQLGSGYSIAMRDLEMRGAGELLGTRQHGYIAAVGFHLYTRLLAQAVGRQQREHGIPVHDTELGKFDRNIIPVNVDLPIDLGIPVDYVPDQNVRLRLYRRLAELQTETEVEAIEEEFRDRFGEIPDQVKNMFFQIKVKLLAEAVNLASVGIENDQIVLRFPPLPEGVTSRMLQSIGSDVRIGKNAYWLPGIRTDDNWRDHLLKVLEKLANSDQNINHRR